MQQQITGGNGGEGCKSLYLESSKYYWWWWRRRSKIPPLLGGTGGPVAHGGGERCRFPEIQLMEHLHGVINTGSGGGGGGIKQHRFNEWW